MGTLFTPGCTSEIMKQKIEERKSLTAIGMSQDLRNWHNAITRW